MNYPAVTEKSVLVTGCSSGIGRAVAELLRSNGWCVIPTARKAEDLEELRSAGFDPVALDVAASESVNAAVKEALALTGGSLGAIVNNAGFGMPGAMEDLSRDAMRYQFEVNLFGLQELTNHCIPLFRAQGYGRVVNISSVVGRLALPFMGIYSASKFALEAVSDALRVELSADRIAVALIEPGPIDSKFSSNCAGQGAAKLDTERSHFGASYRNYFKLRQNGGMSEDRFRLPPEAVAQKVLHALESSRPRVRYKITVLAYMGDFSARFIPARLKDKMLTKHVKKRFQ